MSQHSIYELLKGSPNRWFKSQEISKKLNISVPAVSHGVRPLVKWKEIDSKTVYLPNKDGKKVRTVKYKFLS